MKNVCVFLMAILCLGKVYGQTWSEKAILTASDGAPDSRFGASVSISGDYAVVGSIYEQKDAQGANPLRHCGAAYIFERESNGSWNQIQKIVASDRVEFTSFASTVAISGGYLIVGAPNEGRDATGGNDLIHAGAAYIYEIDGNGQWNEVQKIVASDRELGDNFGGFVTIEGNTIVVTAKEEGHDASGANFLDEAGSAYIFERDNNGQWNETQKIVASDRAEADEFGWNASLDGNYLVFGVPFEDHDATGGNTHSKAGSAYIFQKDGNGKWNEIQKIVASDRSNSNHFGNSVCIHGNYLIVGAYEEDHDSNGMILLKEAGAAYIFEKDGNGGWNEVQKIVPIDRERSDYFGASVAINDDLAIVGAYWEDGDTNGGDSLSGAGSAFIFYKNGNTWIEQENIVPSDRVPGLEFGRNVALSEDHAIFGALRAGGTDSTGWELLIGAAYIFESGFGTGISQNDFGPELSHYPNPTTGHLTINLGKHYHEITVKVHNVLGQLVQTLSFKEAEVLDLTINGPKGLYILDIQTESGEKASIKVMKQ